VTDVSSEENNEEKDDKDQTYAESTQIINADNENKIINNNGNGQSTTSTCNTLPNPESNVEIPIPKESTKQQTTFNTTSNNQQNQIPQTTFKKQKALSKSQQTTQSNQLIHLLQRAATKQYLIKRAPKILTLHLKRFMQLGDNLQKISLFVSFPEILDLSAFTTADNKDSSLKYKLYGVVKHSGELTGGHYTAYVRNIEHTNVEKSGKSLPLSYGFLSFKE
jgi:hypothetical protein